MDLPGPGELSNMVGSAEARAQQARLGGLARSVADGHEDLESLEKAAGEFEAVFLNQLMKAMRETVPDNELFNSSGPTKFYQQMHDSEMAKAVAGGPAGLGIADLIVQQFRQPLERELQDDALIGAKQQDRRPDSLPPGSAGPARYRALGQVGTEIAQLARLRAQASRQEPAVADTLRRYEGPLTRAASNSDLDPALILAVVMEESGGDPQARSPQGALGLMQLMPKTAEEMGVGDALQPGDNLAGGSRYLARMLERYDGDLSVALAAYNAGPGNVDRHGGKVPDFPETQVYVRRVLARFESLKNGTDLAVRNP